MVEWEEDGDKVIVRRAGTFSSEDIHRALFADKRPEPHTLDELKEGLRRHIREKSAGH